MPVSETLIMPPVQVLIFTEAVTSTTAGLYLLPKSVILPSVPQLILTYQEPTTPGLEVTGTSP